MSSTPLTLPVNKPWSACESQAPDTDAAAEHSSTPFADVMDAALAGGARNEAPVGTKAGQEADTSAAAGEVSSDDQETTDDSAVNDNTLAEAAAAMGQPIVAPAKEIVATTVAAPGGNGPAPAVVPPQINAEQVPPSAAVVPVAGQADGKTASADNQGSQPAVGAAANGSGNQKGDVVQSLQGLKPVDSTTQTPTAASATSSTSGDKTPTGPSANPPEIAGQGHPNVPSRAVSAVSDESRGISTAQHMVQMNKMAETSQSPGLTEQNLPVSSPTVAGEELPVAEKRAFSTRAESPVSPASAAGQPVSKPDASALVDQAAQPAALSTATVERTVQLIAQNAVHLREVGTDSLQVVIKPGGDVQLSLELQQRDGTVQVQATLQNGDFHFLKQHWSELQQQLEAKGVRLSSLATEEHANNGDSQFHQKPSARRDEDATPATGSGSLAFATALAAPEIKTPAARSNRGWESWA